MPLTAITTLFGSFVMLVSWLFIGARMSSGATSATKQVKLLRMFFLYMSIFFLLMFLPHVYISLDETKFPLAMAIGYTVGHIFLYLGLLNIGRLTFSIVPKLAYKDRYVLWIGAVLATAITTVNAWTMIWGKQPMYDVERKVTLFNASPLLGASIAIFSAVTVLPAAILMMNNGIHNPESRLRSFLLGAGLFLLMTGGPLHDTARTWQLYTIADMVSIFSLILIAVGVAYRIEERIGWSRTREISPASSS